MAANDMFAASVAEKLQQAKATCELLAKRYTCVVANPPYMGSSSFSPFMSKWVKKNYPDVKSDLCTCFIERGFALAINRGYAAMVTMQSWMFLGSFEKMRAALIDNRTIVSMVHLGPRAFDAIGGEVVNVTADVIYNGHACLNGAYVRLVDTNGSEAKRQKLLEAIKNPDCGWFYRRDADTFKQIPGTPIAYWASDGLFRAFECGAKVADSATALVGIQTGDNSRFLRLWWEPSLKDEFFNCPSLEDCIKSGLKWFPYNKGGDFRKWFGNNDYLILFEKGGKQIFTGENPKTHHVQQMADEYKFRASITWSKISSGLIAFRYKPVGHLFDIAGTSIISDEDVLLFLQGACNSSVISQVAKLLSPTLNYEAGQIATYPVIDSEEKHKSVDGLVVDCRALSKTDWDSFETSWDFKRHPLL
ncbi:MAG: N-6 DNA methylase [Eggerthellaceae bacterium]|nr:N-6 DNA methylase [Eggerthellaceae bacterium]